MTAYPADGGSLRIQPPVDVTRIARFSWAARCGDRFAWGTSEAEAVLNLSRKLELVRWI